MLRNIAGRPLTPRHAKWFQVATAVLRHGRESSLIDLNRSVDGAADAAKTKLLHMVPGLSNNPPQPGTRTSTIQPGAGKHRIYAVSACVPDRTSRILRNVYKLQCSICEVAHHTARCSDFGSLTVDGHHEAVIEVKLCFCV
ncbi:hypothetical protein P879_09447 [Paragonimus westermani]|uniref:Uncharacterized protein n=1 Tax=Paragonimus westermani TaxID=34504 RepID=A0A8T0DGQ9_9TREM|nr:hypothetical protein P879_09447 [Paragonimus westermani]